MIEISYLSTDKIITKLEDAFIEAFHEIPTIISAPSRVNFIGEHMDYNMGNVIIATMNHNVYLAIAPNETNKLNYVFLDIEQRYIGTIDNLKPSEKTWPDYINGVVDQLIKQNYNIGGFNCVITSNVPFSSLSSTGSPTECAVVFALNEIFELGMGKLEMALLAQKAEHSFTGIHTGILVFFAILFGKKNYAIQLDCRTMEYKYIHIRMDDYRILILNAGIDRTANFVDYNRKRANCEYAVKLLQKKYPAVTALRDATLPMINEIIAPACDAETYKLCRYVIEEQQRLDGAALDLANNNTTGFGKKMFASHEALKSELNASCDELDFLIDFVKKESGVTGARLMGAELGSSTINFVKEDAIQELLPRISAAYEKAMNKELKAYVYETSGGVQLIQ